ncbi:Hypothetical protein LEPBI_I1455 [Leptospira biflexa serovar Patoc strain 'Patoc 1 (Paris)']|uniref:Uncharacterized protein n=2 Tax=Leptospira biflexa TaxID=172 RepID=B0SPZ7_LEPBP|nr:Hypothetical protein LEPBI_I1455 [Leptospira biflexa serovar Patoc strain 'Patoc 1 (Paris)']
MFDKYYSCVYLMNMKPAISKALHPKFSVLSLEEKLEILKEDPNFRLLVEQMYQNYKENRSTVIL